MLHDAHNGHAGGYKYASWHRSAALSGQGVRRLCTWKIDKETFEGRAERTCVLGGEIHCEVTSPPLIYSLSTTGELLVGHLSSSDGEGVRRTMRVGAGADRALGHADTIRAFGSRQRLSLMMCHHQKKLYLLMFCVKTRRQT
eukprot:6189710-Pleurochrysis_carterae.AAC.1